jgi:hypothetical protein
VEQERSWWVPAVSADTAAANDDDSALAPPGYRDIRSTQRSRDTLTPDQLNRELHHRNLVSLREVILEDKAIYMVFEYAEHDFLVSVTLCPVLSCPFLFWSTPIRRSRSGVHSTATPGDVR